MRFIPRLPAAKTRAAETIQIGNAAKLFVGFRKVVWPEDVFDVDGAGASYPSFGSQSIRNHRSRAKSRRVERRNW